MGTAANSLPVAEVEFEDMSSFKLVDTDISDDNGQARFTVFGVGGGGGNAVEHMVRSGITGVKFVCANTDKQALDKMSAPIRLQLGTQSTRGLGAGANPEVGRQAAEEERDAIQKSLEGADMVFITAGMGGGTGTGAAPVIASIAREMGILTVGVVTTPFGFEGRKRTKAAEQGISGLASYVDSLIIIPNQKLLTVYRNISMNDAFKKADDVLLNAVRSIFDMIVNHGLINLDFADLRTAMTNSGYAMMGMGSARGDDRARQAAEMAIRSPLLDNIRLENAKGIVVNVTSSEDLQPAELDVIGEIIQQIADMDEGDIMFGTVFDPEARDELRVTVIATGLTRNADVEPTASTSAARSAAAARPAAAAPAAAPADEDDLPAISRRAAPAAAATSPSRPAADKPAPISIQDFLKNHQKR